MFFNLVLLQHPNALLVDPPLIYVVSEHIYCPYPLSYIVDFVESHVRAARKPRAYTNFDAPFEFGAWSSTTPPPSEVRPKDHLSPLAVRWLCHHGCVPPPQAYNVSFKLQKYADVFSAGWTCMFKVHSKKSKLIYKLVNYSRSVFRKFRRFRYKIRLNFIESQVTV